MAQGPCISRRTVKRVTYERCLSAYSSTIGWPGEKRPLCAQDRPIGYTWEKYLRLSDLSSFPQGENRALCAEFPTNLHTLADFKTLRGSYPGESSSLSPELSSPPTGRPALTATDASMDGGRMVVYPGWYRVYIGRKGVYPPWYTRVHREASTMVYPGT